MIKRIGGSARLRQWLAGLLCIVAGATFVFLLSTIESDFRRRWKHVRRGMDGAEVREILGEPTSRMIVSELLDSALGDALGLPDRWTYERGPNRVRHRVFFEDGRVVGLDPRRR